MLRRAMIQRYQTPRQQHQNPRLRQTLQAAQNLLMVLMGDLGAGLVAFISYDKLLKDYRTIDPSYAP